MQYTAPKMEFLASSEDALMISLDDLFAINLWDMLLEEEE